MDTSHQIRLRLRFYKDVVSNINSVRKQFELYKEKGMEDFSVKVNENHIWIHIVGSKKQYYSPHLHLELEDKEGDGTHIRGLFGPDPTLWTLFMFLHFIVAGIFLIFGMIAYSNYTMSQPFFMDGIVMCLMVVVWFLLYFIAKQIREKGNGQMDALEHLFEEIVLLL